MNEICSLGVEVLESSGGTPSVAVSSCGGLGWRTIFLALVAGGGVF